MIVKLDTKAKFSNSQAIPSIRIPFRFKGFQYFAVHKHTLNKILNLLELVAYRL